MKLIEQIIAITKTGREQGRSDDFIALAVVFWMEWNMNLSLGGNGFLDDDQATVDALDDETKIEDLKQFMTSAGVISWYNKTPV